MRRRRFLLTSFSFACILFRIVRRRTANLPFLVFPQTCVKHRKSNVSGFPSLRSLRSCAAKRPNRIRRVFAFQCPVRGSQVLHIVHVAQERCELLPPVLPRRFAYPFERARHVPPALRLPQTNVGPPGSRAGWFRKCLNALIAQGRNDSCDGDSSRIAFRLRRQRRHLRSRVFRGSMSCLCVPLSTLRICSCEQVHMTRGRSDSLFLLRAALSSTPSCRFYLRSSVTPILFEPECR